MDSETKKLIGNFDWFWNYLNITEKNPWDIAAKAEREEIPFFNAILTALMHCKKNGWIEYTSTELGMTTVELLANDFVLNHSMVPYVGRSMRTATPISCFEGTMDGVKNKLAFWENGLIYGASTEQGSEEIYLVMLEPIFCKTKNVPTPEEAKAYEAKLEEAKTEQ
jgi:hypothetical protein